MSSESVQRLRIPLTDEDVRSLKTGDVVILSGTIFTARDMAHLRLKELFENKKELPKDFNGGVIFHAGPVALKDDKGAWSLNVIGPTTSIRMEPYAELVGKLGIKALIGKGGMADDTLKAASTYGYIYLQAVPGAAAKLAEGIQAIRDVLWFDLGMPEALWDLQAKDFGPLVVGMDTHGESIYNNIKRSAMKKIDELYPLN
jgi:fumarate hydratase subunit beta/L(+)-tartrate dehydratase beta subunit